MNFQMNRWFGWVGEPDMLRELQLDAFSWLLNETNPKLVRRSVGAQVCRSLLFRPSHASLGRDRAVEGALKVILTNSAPG
jgi:hypothetical protein